MADRVKTGELKLKMKLYEEEKIHPNPKIVEKKDVDWIFMTSALNFSFWNNPNDPSYLVTYQVFETTI